MISLITSLYRSECHLQKYICSVEKFYCEAEGIFQFELLIIANDPTQAEEEKLSILEKMKNVRIIRVPQESLYASWNRGVCNARYDIVGFWNVDDVRFACGIEAGLRDLSDGSPMVYFPFIYKRYVKIFGYNFLVKIKKINPPAFTENEFVRSMHCGPFFIFKKDFYEKVGPFDEQFKIVGDFEWCVRAAKSGRLKRVDCVAGVFYNYGTSLSGSKDCRHIAENNIVAARHGVLDKIMPIQDNFENDYEINKIISKFK